MSGRNGAGTQRKRRDENTIRTNLDEADCSRNDIDD